MPCIDFKTRKAIRMCNNHPLYLRLFLAFRCGSTIVPEIVTLINKLYNLDESDHKIDSKVRSKIAKNCGEASYSIVIWTHVL